MFADIPVSGVSALAVRELGVSTDLLASFEALREDAFPWLLDSALPRPRIGRYSFAGSDPYLVLRAYGREIEIQCRRASRPGLVLGRRRLQGDPFEAVRALLPAPPDADEVVPLPFVGGAVGYYGYELGALLEPVPARGPDEFGLADLTFLFVDHLLAFDQLEDRCYALGLGFGRTRAEAQARAAVRVRQIERKALPRRAGPSFPFFERAERRD